jgi:hypothetical protein
MASKRCSINCLIAFCNRQSLESLASTVAAPYLLLVQVSTFSSLQTLANLLSGNRFEVSNRENGVNASRVALSLLLGHFKRVSRNCTYSIDLVISHLRSALMIAETDSDHGHELLQWQCT